MAEYDKTYQQTHDIDWFCKIGNTAMHFASNGGLLPKKVNNREVNSHIQHVVATMDDVVTSDYVTGCSPGTTFLIKFWSTVHTCMKG